MPGKPDMDCWDFLPEEKIMRQKIVDTLKGVFETFGFSPLETPSLEKWEILSRKYAGGEEILKEVRKIPHREDLPIFIISVDGLDEKKYVELGATDFVLKPFDPNTLMQKIEMVFEEKLF